MKRLLFIVTACVSVAVAEMRATGFAFDQSGNLFFQAANPDRIFKFSPDGAVSMFAEAQTMDWDEMAIDAKGNVFVTTSATRKGDVVTALLKFTPPGKRTAFVPEVAKGQPSGLAIDQAGNLFVGVTSLDKFHPGDSIVKVAASDKKRTVFAQDLKTPAHMTFDHSGNLFVYSEGMNTILKFSPDGKKTVVASGITAYSLAFDPAGNLFVADFGGNAILKYDNGGAKTTFTTKVKPWSLAFNAKGELFVLGDDAESGASGILKIAPDGSRTLFAKNPID